MASQGSGFAASVDFVFSKFISLIPLKPWPGRKSLHTTLLLWVHSVSSRANKSGLIRRGSAERRCTGRYLRGTWVLTAAPAGRSNPVPLLPPGGILLEVLWRTLPRFHVVCNITSHIEHFSKLNILALLIVRTIECSLDNPNLHKVEYINTTV